MRLAEPADAIDILVVRAASWRTAYRDILPARYLARLTASWERKFPAGTWLVERDRIVVGYCITGCEDLADVPEVVEIRELYVFPDLWRTGLGTTLLDAVMAELAKGGARIVALEVLSANARGVLFYQARGFRHAPKRDRTVDVDGRKLAALHYRRAL